MGAVTAPTTASTERTTAPGMAGSSTTGGAATPATPADQALVQRLEALQRALNQKIAFNADGTLSAGKEELKNLALFLDNNPGKFGSRGGEGLLSTEVLTRGLSADNRAEGLAKRRQAVTAFVNSLPLKSQRSGTTPSSGSAGGSATPSPGGAEADESAASGQTIVDTLRVNNASSIGLFSKKEDIEVLHSQAATASAPALTVFINKNHPETAYISVSRVGSDGKLTATEIAAVASADVLGSAGSRTSKLDATIWTPGTSGAKDSVGQMDLSGLTEADVGKIQEALRSKLKPKTTPPQAPGGRQGSTAPDQTAGGGAGSGNGSASPETSPPPAGAGSGQPAPQPARLSPDGRLDKAEGMLLLRTPGVLDKLRSEFDTEAVVRSGKDNVELVFPDTTVRFNWKDGQSTVNWRVDVAEPQRHAWIKQFEQRLGKVIDGTTEASPVGATRIMGNPEVVKDWLRRPGAFESLQSVFSGQVRKNGDTVIIDDIAPFRTVEINGKTGKVTIRNTGLINLDSSSAARTAEVTALVERRLVNARQGFLASASLIGNSATFDPTDKRAIATWLDKPGLGAFLKQRFGHSDVQENDKTIQVTESGLTVTLQKGSGAVMIQKHEGPFGGTLRNVTTNPAEVTRVKDWLRAAMVAFDAR